jgi:thiamine pyrophosphate-dependent acetolactate synthase large subunit-like protein/nitrite reductase/ring-hydroxylating ferredoxin subunit
MEEQNLVWYPVLELDALPEGRVTTVGAGDKAICLTHWEGRISALDNRCPHQGGPLGEGSIEKGWLRCPWHGWDYHPCTGRPPAGYADAVPTYPVRVEDGRIEVGIQERVRTTRTVSDAVVDTLVRWGVRAIFGMVGHSNLGLAEAIRRRVETADLRFFGVRHEGAAAFAASAYGKLTGRPAACLSIAGPGATNLLTGLWDAKVDRAPVIALTGQVATQYLGPGNFQECDLTAAFAPVAAFSQTVLRAENAKELTALALKHAITRREVGHLILPDEVQVLPEHPSAADAPPEGRLPDFGIAAAPAALEAAIGALRVARRPVFVLGHGAREAAPELIRLAEHLDAPVVTTFKGKGLIPDHHPLAGGVLGRSCTPFASWLMTECDLLVVFGASFSKHTGITTHKLLIQVDYDPMAIAKFHRVDYPVWGEIGRTAEALRAAFEAPIARGSADEVAQRWAIWRAEKRKRAKDDRGLGLPAAYILDQLSRVVPEDAVIAIDVGNNAYSFGRYFESKGQRVLMSGYLGSIGFGVPAAMGAAAAAPGRKILAICGDGGLGQYLAEITTLVKYDLDVTVVVLDNGQLGKISKEQRASEYSVWETSLVNPDFAAFATSCGALGIAVSTRAELQVALQRAIDHPGPALVAIRQDAALV